MKKYLVLFVCIGLLSGCSSVRGLFGKNSSSQAKQLAKVELLENRQSINTQDKLAAISPYAFGINYSLNASTNKEELPIKFAKEMNDRIVSLSPSPTIAEINEIKQLFNSYTTNISLWKKEMNVKDQEILGLQLETKKLQNQWNIEIDKYKNLAAATALKTDALQASLNEMNSWGGIGAIWYGVKRLVVRLAWFLGIGSVLFIILRFSSATNPIAGALFGVFSMVGGYCIKFIQVLIPKAVELSGNIATSAYNEVHDLLKKIVDNVQSLKEIQSKSGHDLTLRELFIELDKSLDKSEKEIIGKIKNGLGY